MIQWIAGYLPVEVLKQLTHPLIGSQVSYCSAIWGNAALSEIGRLQKPHNKAARIILSCAYGTPVAELHTTLGWLAVNDITDKSLLSLCNNKIIITIFECRILIVVLCCFNYFLCCTMQS